MENEDRRSKPSPPSFSDSSPNRLRSSTSTTPDRQRGRSDRRRKTAAEVQTASAAIWSTLPKIQVQATLDSLPDGSLDSRRSYPEARELLLKIRPATHHPTQHPTKTATSATRSAASRSPDPDPMTTTWIPTNENTRLQPLGTDHAELDGPGRHPANRPPQSRTVLPVGTHARPRTQPRLGNSRPRRPVRPVAGQRHPQASLRPQP